MPSSQQISLNLVAQLDQGNIESQAAQMASTMARAIETAFEQLGQRIASTILSGVRTGLQGSIEAVGHAYPGALTETQRQLISTNIAQGPMPAAQPFGNPAAPGMPPMPPVMPGQGPVAQPNSQPTQSFVPGVVPETQGGFLNFLSANKKGLIGLGGAIGTGLSFAGEAPGIMRGNAAAEAELSNLSGRALMRGDIDSAVVQQQMGGGQAMRSQATKETGTIIAGEIVGALVGIAGGLAMASTGAGMVPGLAIAGAGLSSGIDAARRGLGFESQVEQNVQGRTQAERQRQMEFLQMGQMSRQMAMDSFQASQTMGGREMSEFLFSGARSPQMAIDALNEARMANLPAQQRAPFINDVRLARAGAVTGAGGEQQSLLEFGRDIGLMPEQVNATMRQIGGIGRIFGGQTQLQGMQPQVADMLNLQAFGVQDAGRIAGGFARGGTQTEGGLRQSFETVKDLVTEMVAAGFDKASINKAMLTVMQQAGQGLGATGPAVLQAERAAATASAMFGGQVTEAQSDFTQRAMAGFGRATSAGGGMMGAAGFAATRATQGMLGKAGIKTGLKEELIMQKFGGGAISPQAIMELAKQQGVEMTMEHATELARESQTNVLQAEDRAFGMFGAGGDLAAAETAGAKTDVEAFQARGALRTGIKAPSFVGPRQQIGQQVVGGGVPGAQETAALAGVNVAQITGGVQTFGTNLQAINRSLNELLSKIQGVTRDFAQVRGSARAHGGGLGGTSGLLPTPEPASVAVSPGAYMSGR